MCVAGCKVCGCVCGRERRELGGTNVSDPAEMEKKRLRDGGETG